jgi:hypothetical protein
LLQLFALAASVVAAVAAAVFVGLPTCSQRWEITRNLLFGN